MHTLIEEKDFRAPGPQNQEDQRNPGEKLGVKTHGCDFPWTLIYLEKLQDCSELQCGTCLGSRVPRGLGVGSEAPGCWEMRLPPARRNPGLTLPGTGAEQAAIRSASLLSSGLSGERRPEQARVGGQTRPQPGSPRVAEDRTGLPSRGHWRRPGGGRSAPWRPGGVGRGGRAPRPLRRAVPACWGLGLFCDCTIHPSLITTS